MNTIKQKNNEVMEIEKTVQNYFQGYLRADEDLLSSAFHSGTRLYSANEGKLEETKIADWFKNIRERRVRGDIRKAHSEIASIDLSGDAAVVKAALTFSTFQFIDYLSLLQIKNKWVIVNKIYTVNKNES